MVVMAVSVDKLLLLVTDFMRWCELYTVDDNLKINDSLFLEGDGI